MRNRRRKAQKIRVEEEKGRMRRTERGSYHQCGSKNMLYIILKFPRILSPFCSFCVVVI